MRDYGKVHTSFWSSTGIRALSEDGRTLALYLLTCPHGTIAGVFRLPDGYASEDLQWSYQRVREGFSELFANGFVSRCETTNWTWIVKHLDWNPPANPNQRKAVAKVAERVPDECSWKPDFMRVCAERIGLAWEPKKNPSRTVPKPLANQQQEQKQEQEQKKEEAPRAPTPRPGTLALPAVDAPAAPPLPTSPPPSLDPAQGKGTTPKTRKPSAKLDLSVLPESLEPEVWEDWLRHRRALRAPMNTQTGLNRIANELKRCIERGIDPNHAIGESIAAGWRGIKADWLENRIKSTGNRTETDSRWFGLNEKDYSEGINPDGTF